MRLRGKKFNSIPVVLVDSMGKKNGFYLHMMDIDVPLEFLVLAPLLKIEVCILESVRLSVHLV